MEAFLHRMHELLASGTPMVMVTLVEIQGSVPRDQGGRMLVTPSGLEAGTVGGGLLESRALEFARELFSEDNPARQKRFLEWNLNKDLGMSCGGSVKMFFERVPAESWQIVVYGAGHVAQALLPLLLMLDCRVSCIDSREDWLVRLPDSPKLTITRAEDLSRTVDQVPQQAFVMLMTQGHQTDSPLLKRFLERGNQTFLGVIGSRAKAAVLRRELQDEGLSAAQCKAFTCPLGLSLGGNQPEEIAVSITAQLLLVRDRVYGIQHQRQTVPEFK